MHEQSSIRTKAPLAALWFALVGPLLGLAAIMVGNVAWEWVHGGSGRLTWDAWLGATLFAIPFALGLGFVPACATGVILVVTIGARPVSDRAFIAAVRSWPDLWAAAVGAVVSALFFAALFRSGAGSVAAPTLAGGVAAVACSRLFLPRPTSRRT